MVDLETGSRRFKSLLIERCSALLERLQNVMLFQEVDGLRVPGKFRLYATLDTDG